jgi:cytochrome c
MSRLADAQYRRRRVVQPAAPGKAGLRDRRPGAAGGNAGRPGSGRGQRLASADVKRGETAAKKCAACHTFAKGEPNRVGPNLYGVVGRKKDAAPGFNYSAAMKKQEGNWTVEDLDHFLTNPRGAIPGTAMSFAGLPRGKERADVIAYLNSNSDSPQDLSKLAAAAAPAKQADAPKAEAPKPQ